MLPVLSRGVYSLMIDDNCSLLAIFNLEKVRKLLKFVIAKINFMPIFAVPPGSFMLGSIVLFLLRFDFQGNYDTSCRSLYRF